MAKLEQEAVMTIHALAHRGCSNRETARLLGVTEAAVRYHLRRQETAAVDGRSRQQATGARFHGAIEAYLASQGVEAPENVAELHAWLVAEHDYPGSRRNLQRYVRRAFPPPARRARRRVETPPGAQAQVDWAEWRGVWVAGRCETLYTLHMQLSYSRFPALVWSSAKHELAWLAAHNGAFRRLGGVPATLRVDNEKTAIARGAGTRGEVNATYRRYAEALRFHVDAYPPREPQAKGKVERRILEQRLSADPRHRHWESLAALQDWTDARVEASAKRRRCPATGASVWEAFLAERAALGPLPEPLPEPFDLAVTRRVGPDCTVTFEDHAYSVPFALLGQSVEVRGCAHHVQVLAGAQVVAQHPRRTPERVVIDPDHYQGPATATVLPPPPLGRMGQRLTDLAAMAPEQRPVDLYAALAEVAR